MNLFWNQNFFHFSTHRVKWKFLNDAISFYMPAKKVLIWKSCNEFRENFNFNLNFSLLVKIQKLKMQCVLKRVFSPSVSTDRQFEYTCKTIESCSWMGINSWKWKLHRSFSKIQSAFIFFRLGNYKVFVMKKQKLLINERFKVSAYLQLLAETSKSWKPFYNLLRIRESLWNLLTESLKMLS